MVEERWDSAHDDLREINTLAISFKEARERSDPDADKIFVELWKKSQTRIFRFVRGKCGDDHMSNDVLQEAAIKIYYCINQFGGRNFLGWAFQISSNACCDELRKQQKHKHKSLDSSNMTDKKSPPAGEVPQTHEENAIMRRVLQLCNNLSGCQPLSNWGIHRHRALERIQEAAGRLLKHAEKVGVPDGPIFLDGPDTLIKILSEQLSKRDKNIKIVGPKTWPWRAVDNLKCRVDSYRRRYP